MGRFSRLETGHAPAAPPPPTTDTLEPVTYYPPAESQPDEQELSTQASLGRADQALFGNDYKGAERWYSRAMGLDSTLLAPWLGVIRTLLLRGRLSEAYTWNGRGLTVFPESPELTAMRAVIYARRGFIRRAMTNSDAVLEQNASLPLAHLARGEVLILAENKNFDFCFEQCLKMAPPHDWKTSFLIGLILEERRMWGKALVYFSHTAERSEHIPALWFHVGRCRAQLGHRHKAQKAFDRARELCAPGDPLLSRLDQAGPGSLWRRLSRFFSRK